MINIPVRAYAQFQALAQAQTHAQTYAQAQAHANTYGSDNL